MTKKRATLEDVARLAGVSLGSASRSLSMPDEVRSDTLERVQRAVAQLGYVRNGAAQALASRRTKTIAAIYPTLDNPIFAVSIQALQQTLWALGYHLIVASHDYEPEREADLLRRIVERGVDGIVLVGTDHADAVYDLQRQYQLPYVLSWAVDDARAGQCVGFSYLDAAQRMASLVVEQGHTRIALCPGIAASNERVRARIQGTRAALSAHGLPLRNDWIVEGPFTFEGGRDAVAQLCRTDDRPTALICGTDIQAVGAIGECRDRGIRVPDDLSITGSDDIELASLVEPRLTTVHVPTSEIGRLSARRIVDLIEGRSTGEPAALQTTLVQRESLRRVGRTDSETQQERRK
ncbi:LacI family DNA-binding transcriptional regulator [Variovorax sp. J22P271]|uniref:LacI family DNA-binding transcriptional regulator n=1 Tax=Variovorax davisae TaxID=3053515 RepID=UPI002577A464|nr:LacI family DNA-binding transcriptional regulator [Variovorax sp. J22P271]MDM0035297.1 LacI family DNA-binding transcriptional regulator [Variovorax sp. J22P271]